MSYFEKKLEDEPKLYKERIPDIKRLEECYKKLGEVLAQTYGVPSPKVRFSWLIYTESKFGAAYSSWNRTILVTYVTTPYNFAHEFKHYLQDIVEGRDYDDEIVKGMRVSVIDYSKYWLYPMEIEAREFAEKYYKFVQEEGKKIHGYGTWSGILIRDKLREGEIPDFVITAFKRKVKGSVKKKI